MINLTIKYLEFQNRSIFKDLKYTFEDDSTYVIKGKSGSGKTTLLQIILGNLSDFEGEITISGKPPNEDLRRRIGFLLQSHPMIDNERVREYCISNAVICGTPRNRAAELADKYLKMFKVDHLTNRKIKKLSGGEKQRVALCGELCKEPDILLLDEPTGSLDGENTQIVYNAMKNISGKIIIIVTHNRISDDLGMILTIQDGKLLESK